jgi:hypothetical protein
MFNSLRKIALVSCITIIILFSIILLINFIGIFINPYTVELYFHRPNDTTISYDTALSNINLLNKRYKNKFNLINHQDELFIINNIVNTVFDRMSNLTIQKYCGKDFYKISIFDNWILFIKSYLFASDFPYDFSNPYRALKRGAGLCSQQSIVVAELLREFGFKTGVTLLGKNAHVVGWVKTKKGIYILDADYGVILPFDFKYACHHKNELLEYYKNMKLQLLNKEEEAKKIVDIYCCNNREIFEYKQYEDLLYIIKWLVPVIVIIIALLCILITNSARFKTTR